MKVQTRFFLFLIVELANFFKKKEKQNHQTTNYAICVCCPLDYSINMDQHEFFTMTFFEAKFHTHRHREECNS